HIDWKATFSNIIKHFLLMTFSFFVGLLLASYFDFSMPEPKKGTDSEYSEIMSLQKQVQDWQNNYNEMLNKIK
ncbi:MAG TPA: hypothetical protein DIC64_01790, partial [Alphaproteobacteria bacterium]|nr:hypothetical protein [Alphaproteobacteria bacterium]